MRELQVCNIDSSFAFVFLCISFLVGFHFSDVEYFDRLLAGRWLGIYCMG